MLGRQDAGGSGAERRIGMSTRANAFDGPPEQMYPSLPPAWRCKHDYPILVLATESRATESRGKRALCLGCKKLGPEGEDAEQARQRLVELPKTRARWEGSL
jgi:hypothetical protein